MRYVYLYAFIIAAFSLGCTKAKIKNDAEIIESASKINMSPAALWSQYLRNRIEMTTLAFEDYKKSILGKSIDFTLHRGVPAFDVSRSSSDKHKYRVTLELVMGQSMLGTPVGVQTVTLLTNSEIAAQLRKGDGMRVQGIITDINIYPYGDGIDPLGGPTLKSMELEPAVLTRP